MAETLARTGTSGFSFAAWKGPFYPQKLPASKMLAHYGAHLGTVEINASFYKVPAAATLASWARQVPPAFRFSLKASRFVTHSLKLAGAADALVSFFEIAAALGDALGPLLVQVPPFVRNDATLLANFLSAVPAGRRVALDFRDPSWRNDSIYALLRDFNAAWVVSESDDDRAHEPRTATWDYLRLRKSFYSSEEIAAWARRVEGREAFVYFKHEDEARGPEFALSLAAELARGPR